MDASRTLADRALESLTTSGMAASDAESRVRQLRRTLAGIAEPRSVLWVPGRIEVLGKHTDYSGGRSLLAATHRGFWFCAALRRDGAFCAVDVRDGDSFTCAMGEHSEAPVGTWGNYPATAVRRLVRNFGPLDGVDVRFLGDLPQAAGLSGSSALIVGFALCILAVNAVAGTDSYTSQIRTRAALAEYLGTIENGQSFGNLTGERGVGTFGGSEDHTAMLTCRGGHLEQYRFCPVVHERSIPCPPNIRFIVASSGVRAEKTGEALALYNRASALARSVVSALGGTESNWATVASAVEAIGVEACRARLQTVSHLDTFSSEARVRRFDQFVEESERLIPAAGDALVEGDLKAFGAAVATSQHVGAEKLGNQVNETIFLADAANEEGAIAASAFGAGFGGSVWAAVHEAHATSFTEAWKARYVERFPQHSEQVNFFTTRPGPGVIELSDSQSALLRPDALLVRNPGPP